MAALSLTEDGASASTGEDIQGESPQKSESND